MKKLFRLLPFALLPLLFPSLALATHGGLVPHELLGISDVVAVVRGIIRFILTIAFVASFLFLLIGGLRWITSGGDEKNVASARNMITAAIVGLVVVLLSYAIIKLVETFFGVSIISTTPVIPTINSP